MNLSELRHEWLGNARADALAGIVVALALIPEAIAFAVIAGVDPKVALYASFSIAVPPKGGARFNMASHLSFDTVRSNRPPLRSPTATKSR